MHIHPGLERAPLLRRGRPLRALLPRAPPAQCTAPVALGAATSRHANLCVQTRRPRHQIRYQRPPSPPPPPAPRPARPAPTPLPLRAAPPPASPLRVPPRHLRVIMYIYMYMYKYQYVLYYMITYIYSICMPRASALTCVPSARDLRSYTYACYIIGCVYVYMHAKLACAPRACSYICICICIPISYIYMNIL